MEILHIWVASYLCSVNCPVYRRETRGSDCNDFPVGTGARRQVHVSLTPNLSFSPPDLLICFCSGFHTFHINNSFCMYFQHCRRGMVVVMAYCWHQWAYLGRVDRRMGERNEGTEKRVGSLLALNWCSVCICYTLSSGSGVWCCLREGKSVCKSQGHVTHFSVTQVISGARPKIFYSIDQANLFFCHLNDRATSSPAAPFG